MPALCIQSPLGPLTIKSQDGAIVSLDFKSSKASDNALELIQAYSHPMPPSHRS